MPTGRSSASKAKKIRKSATPAKKKKTAKKTATKSRNARPAARKKVARKAPARKTRAKARQADRPASPVFGVSPTYLKALAEYEKAMAVFHKRNFEKAETMFAAVVKEHPGEKDLTDRARVYLNMCRQHTEQEARLRGFDDHYNRGVYHANRREHGDAVTMFEKALKLDPRSEKTHYGLAAALVHVGESSRALDHLRQAVEMNGVNRMLARRDEDFEPLKGTPEFDELIGSLGE